MQDAQPGKVLGKFPGNFEGAVLAAVFDHQHFVGVGLFFQKCKDLPQGAGRRVSSFRAGMIMERKGGIEEEDLLQHK